jgi:hypothetical protein
MISFKNVLREPQAGVNLNTCIKAFGWPSALTTLALFSSEC